MKSFINSRFLILFLFFFSFLSSYAQTDTEFWFVAPEVTESHGTFPGGEPVYFRVSALDLASTVRIYQPARSAGLDTTFDVAANSTVSIDATAWIDDIENNPGDLVLDKGIHITSTNLVTVYYDEDEFYNRDIFALKGKNGLGKEFYTPFNDQWRNGPGYAVPALSAIDIVATEDNTQITITPSKDIVGHTAGSTFTITLNRGETYSCVAADPAAAEHLGGTHIVSDKPIAVTIKDDSVYAEPKGCRDLVGDQLVPMKRTDGRNIAGFEYIAMRGKINLNDINEDPEEGTPRGERIFIMAIEPNTEVFIDGVSYATIVNAGEQVDYELASNSTHIRGDKRIMVLHVSGFGCEFGGAVLPTIDGCTGSLEVSFTRSTDEGFYLNILTDVSAKDAFTLHYEDGSTFDIPGGWFEDVGTTGFVTLMDANKLFANGTGGGVPQDEVVKITNSVSVFHLGLIEGGRSTGCKYGYFSDYAETRGSALVVESGSQSIGRCFGDTVQLRASGGLTYSWSPADYLDDPFIANPIASPPPGVYNYTVTLDRACFEDTSFTIIVGISTEVEAWFEIDKWYFCSPDTVIFDNQSFGVDKSNSLNVQWDFDLDDPSNGYVYDTSQIVQYPFQNTTDSIQKKTVQLLVWNQQGCVSEFQRELQVRPEISAGFTTDVTAGCHPLDVNFTNTSTGNTDRYKWTLGDGNSSNQSDPSHTYINQGMDDSLYHVSMVAISPFFCSDTATTDISVYPYIEAGFAIDTFQSCSPFLLEIDNNSSGYIEEYEWTFGDGSTSDTTVSSFTHLYSNTSDTVLNASVKLAVRNLSGGCADSVTHNISVFPEVTASFTQDTTAGCNGVDVQFTNQSASTASIFNWDFGDGGSSSQTDPLHSFENMGMSSTDYTVRLVSTTDDLCRDTAYQDISVHPYINADFSTDKFQGCAPFLLNVQNAADGAISQFAWDWGDGSAGSTSGGSTLNHIYQNNDSVPVVNALQLIVSNTDGCEDTMTRNITVFPVVISQFTQDVTEGCEPLQVQFTNQSNVYATSFLWEFGDGGTSDERDPLHLYENFDSVNITNTARLIATSDENCADTSEQDITVYSNLYSDFTVDITSSCTPFDVSFSNSSVGGVRFRWDYGDGTDTTLLTASQVIHRYDNSSLTDSAQYEAVLTAWNADSCTSVSKRTITVFPEVTAVFSADTSQGCHPLSVSFTNSSTGASAYSWDFANEKSSDETDPLMRFDNYGSADTTFNVMLVATNIQLCTDAMVIPVTVHPNINANFSTDEFQGCAPFDLTVQNAAAGGISQYEWDWGDGSAISTSGGSTLNHTYQNNDSLTLIYPLQLVVSNTGGCTDTMVRNISVFPVVTSQFTQDITEGCEPLQVQFTNQSEYATSFLWDFGDGGSSHENDPTHLYQNLDSVNISNTTRMIALSDENCADTSELDITVYSYLDADFTIDNTSSCTPFDVSFNNSSSGGVRFHWDFGDGSDTTVLTDLPVTHRYDNSSLTDSVHYRAVLTVWNADSCSSATEKTVAVFPEVTAVFTADTSQGCHPLSVTLTNNSTGASAYKWDFDNDKSSVETNPVISLENYGSSDTIYNIMLVASNQQFCTDTLVVPVTVHPYVEADFSADYPIQCTPANVSFNNSSINGNQFTWTFDTAVFQTSSTNSLVRQFINSSYTTSQVFSIELQAVSLQGCTSTMTRQIEVYHDVEAGFQSDSAGCYPLVLSFDNTSQGGWQYDWLFGDNGTSVDEDPVHTYINLGTADSVYTVELVVTSEDYCRDSVSGQITVHPQPVAKFQVDNTVDCPPFELNILNLTTAGDTYYWTFGDGTAGDTTPDLSSVTHTYYNYNDSTRTYVLEMSAESSFGCRDTVSQNINVYPAITVDFEWDSAGCSPYLSAFNNTSVRITNHFWDFGDGNTSLLVHPTNSYLNNSINDTVFTVKLKGTSRFGCIDSVSRDVTVYPSPLAEFDFNPVYQYYPSATVNLVNESNDGYWDYLWDYGDGQESEQEDPGTYTYSTWGQFNITLDVSSDNCDNSITHWIRIFPPQPVADFEPDIDSGCVEHTVGFTNSSLYAEEYYWDFDDGNSSTAREPVHTYEEPGLYQARLRVTGEGGEDIAYREIEVFRLPVVDFKVAPDTVMLPDQPAKLFNFSEDGELYLWEFGDGQTSTDEETTHLYTELGEYDVTLTVWTENSCMATHTVSNAVIVIGEGEIKYPSAFAPNPNGPSGGDYTLQDVSNEVFHPYYEGVTDYKLLIYNRWGEKVFESDDVNTGWDGYYRGELCQQGVYVWVVKGRYTNGLGFEDAGDVTLVRRPDD